MFSMNEENLIGLIHSWHRHTQHTHNISGESVESFLAQYSDMSADRLTHTHTAINVPELVSPTGNIPVKYNSNLGPRKRQKSALARLLACFHPATKIVSIVANPYIAANEM